MRVAAAILIIPFVLAKIGNAQSSDRDFSGVWRLNPAQSDLRDPSVPPARTLRVSQDTDTLSLSAGDLSVSYPLNGKSRKTLVGDSTWNIVTKWEGTALLANIIVSGPGNYSVAERWARSRDGYRLTITRNVIRVEGETESVLIYESPNAPVSQVAPQSESAPARTTGSFRRQDSPRGPDSPLNPATDYVVASGTRILMRLTNSVDTKHSAVGDRVYLQTAVPVFVSGRVVIPAGSYVTGTITEAQRAGHVKGKSALNLRFESVTLPNGVNRDFRGRAGSVDSLGTLDRSEGKIEGESRTGKNARTVAGTTAAGTGIGTLAGAASGHLGMGMGVGAAAGAVAGLAGVLGSRGPDVIVHAGATIELVLDRELSFTAAELSGRIQ